VEALVTDGTDGDAELGCIQLAPTAWAEESVESIKQRIPTDVRLLTKQQYIDFEKNYWRKGSSIGFVFNFGAILGMLVGAAMIYQVLYADVSDHLGEYATLRAMGYPMIYLCMIVIRQGITMCLVCFAPSILISAGAYHLIRRGTNIVVSMSAPILANVLILTLLASAFSAILVTRRLWSADPVDLF
jgi:putative ABC transport system permease protein